MTSSFDFWGTISSLLDRYAIMRDRMNLQRFGIARRRSLLGPTDILETENLENPASFYNSFSATEKIGPTADLLPQDPENAYQEFFFQSPFANSSAKNQKVTGRLYLSGRENQEVVLWVSGYKGNFRWGDFIALKSVLRLGFDVCVIALPYHGPRSSHPINGSDFLVPDVIATAESFLQSVLDLNQCHDLLRLAFKYQRVYTIGSSLGGVLVSVSSFLRPYDAVSIIMAGSDLADILWNAPLPYLQNVRREMEERFTYENVKRMWRMSDVASFHTQHLTQRYLFISGRFDTVIKPSFSQRLKNSLPRPTHIVYPGGHFSSVFFIPHATRNCVKFFRGEEPIQTKYGLDRN